MKKLYLFMVLALGLQNSVFAQTPGTLTFTFTTPKHTSGNYQTDGRYVLAVWIETQTGTFIKTKMRYWGGNTNDHLPTWQTKSGGNTTDATTGSTLTTFVAKTVTWDGKNVNGTANGTLVADGAYRVAVQITWGHGSATATRYFNFTKGPNADVQTPTADTNFTGISLNWQPTMDTGSASVLPSLTCFPNPTHDRIQLEGENGLKSIRMFNLQGEVVFEEVLTTVIEGHYSKNIDMSSMAAGTYMIEVSNGQGIYTDKIIKE